MVGVSLYGWVVSVWLGCFCMVGVSMYGWGVSVWLGCLCMVGVSLLSLVLITCGKYIRSVCDFPNIKFNQNIILSNANG